MIRNHGNLVPQSAKVRTLEDLFRPPVDLMHKGTFNTVSTFFSLKRNLEKLTEILKSTDSPCVGIR